MNFELIILNSSEASDFLSKLQIALKEAKETKYCLKILVATNIVEENKLLSLIKENEEIIKVIAAIVVKTKQNQSK